MNRALEEQVKALQPLLTPAYVRAEVESLLRQGEDVGGGVNAVRLVRHWIGEEATDVETTWAYAQLKPAMRAALEEIPSLAFFEGD